MFKIGARTVVAGDEAMRWLESYREGAVPLSPAESVGPGATPSDEPPRAA